MSTAQNFAPVALLDKLPVFSPIAVKLMILASDEDVSYKEVARLFSLDPVLAAQILKLANSGLYGRRVAVQSVLQALAMLGLKNISRIAITAALTSGLVKSTSPWMQAWWRHSLASALIAERKGRAKLKHDFAYTAGLLHAVGRLALYRHAPKEYPALREAVRTDGHNFLQCEREHFGVDHVELAGLLLARWGLPLNMRQAVSGHHIPNVDEPLTAAVRAGCFYAETRGFGYCGCCTGNRADEAAGREDASLEDYLSKGLAIEVNRIEIDCALV